MPKKNSSPSLPSPRIGQGVLNYSDKQTFDNISLFGVPEPKQKKGGKTK